jgi:hypothetical protein
VLPAGPPIAPPPISRGRLPLAAGIPILLLRFPEPPAREPSKQHVFVGPFELMECRQQFLLIARAERRRLPVDQDRPICKARRHSLFSRMLST